MSLVGMLKSAVNLRVISSEVLPSLHEWIQVRNGIVNSRDEVVVTQRLAKTIVEEIIKIVNGFPR